MKKHCARMFKGFCSIKLKVTGYIVLALSLIAICVCFSATWYFQGQGYYIRNKEEVIKSRYIDEATNIITQAYDEYKELEKKKKDYGLLNVPGYGIFCDKYNSSKTNLLFTIKRYNNDTSYFEDIFTNGTAVYEKEIIQHQFIIGGEIHFIILQDGTTGYEPSVKAEAAIKSPLQNNDQFMQIQNTVSFIYAIKVPVLLFDVVFSVIALMSLIYLVCSAGYTKQETSRFSKDYEKSTLKNGRHEVTYLSPFFKLPVDVLLILTMLVAIITENWIFSVISHGGINQYAERLLLVTAVVAGGALLIPFAVSLSANIKYGKIFSRTLIYSIYPYIKKPFAAFYEKVIKKLPLMFRCGMLAFVFAAINIISFFVFNNSAFEHVYVYITVFEFAAIIAASVYVARDISKLKKSTEEIAKGNITYKTDTQGMLSELKECGEYINKIGEGFNTALTERVKSERMKSELITNVSHDIKTPLTSIINYINIIKSEDSFSENDKEYIDILDRQAARLKKLIEDLIEASKAATGNIKLNMGRNILNVMLMQVTGEYEERAAAKGLTVITDLPNENIYINADGNYLWRVFDNLMNNIVKYSLAGTRVYIGLKAEKGKAAVEFKNVSEQKLNISPDELMQRFVRGDSSRSTEGSGLGLSIAHDLVVLQKGQFNLSIDGDLFKARVEFDTEAEGELIKETVDQNI